MQVHRPAYRISSLLEHIRNAHASAWTQKTQGVYSLEHITQCACEQRPHSICGRISSRINHVSENLFHKIGARCLEMKSYDIRQVQIIQTRFCTHFTTIWLYAHFNTDTNMNRGNYLKCLNMYLDIPIISRCMYAWVYIGMWMSKITLNNNKVKLMSSYWSFLV